MKKWIWLLLVAAVAGLFALYVHQISTQVGAVKQITHLPWQIEQLPEGRSRVFNVELGASTLHDAMADWQAQPTLGLFEDSAGHRRLEAFFEKVRLGVFEANVVVSLTADQDLLAAFAKRAGKREPQPSGEYKSLLSLEDQAASGDLIISAITYIPTAQYDPEVVTQRFGPPESKRDLDETRALWLYPANGLAIIIDSKKREVLHYTAPGAFEALREQLERL